MRIQISSWAWLDVFDQGMQRADLARLSNQTQDSQFQSILQAWLHRYQRNVTLQHLILDSEMLCSEDGVVTKRGALFQPSWNETLPGCADLMRLPFAQLPLPPNSSNYRTLQGYVDFIRLPIAQVPLPPNITSFHFINIKYVDATLLEFLQQMRRLFTDVNIQFSGRIRPDRAEAIRQATRRSLLHLLPLFAVKSMHISNHEDFAFLLDRFPATVSGATGIFLYELRAVTELGPYNNWLQNGRADGEPRLLLSCVPVWWQQHQLFRQAILERFLAASKPVSYFIIFRVPVHAVDAMDAEVHQNNDTGEQLIVSKHLRHPGEFHRDRCAIMFTRCPINVDPGWLEEKTLWAREWEPEEKIINLEQPIECDLPDDDQLLPAGPPPPPEDVPPPPEDDDEQQPGTSGTSGGGGGSTMMEQRLQQQSGPSSTDEQGPSTSNSSSGN